MATQILLPEGAPERALSDLEVLTAPARRTRWRFELLTKAGAVTPLDGVTSCSLRWNLHTQIRGGGTLHYAGPEIDWHTHRIRAHYEVTAGPSMVTWPLGTYYCAAPKRTYRSADAGHVEIELYDASYRAVVQASTANPYFFPAGRDAISAVRQLLSGQDMPHAIEDGTDTLLRSPMAWQPGTPIQRIANDLLDAAGFVAIHADPLGILRSEPYRAPRYRARAWRFVDDEASIVTPTWEREEDTYSVPSQVILSTTGDDEKPGLVAIATDDSSRFSYGATGVRITHVQEGVESTSQAALNAMAARRLIELQSVTAKAKISCLPVPLEISAVVDHVRAAAGIDALCTVEGISMSTDSPVMDLELREVVG